MSRVVDEATLIAPERARQAMGATAAAVKVFLLMNGRPPTDDAIAARFLVEARDVDCTLDDLQWLAAAGLIPADTLDLWKAQTDANA